VAPCTWLPSTPTPGSHILNCRCSPSVFSSRHVFRRLAFDRFKLTLARARMWPLQSAFDRYRWASSPASWVWMLPLSILAVSEPPGLNQAPGSSFHRITPLPGLLYGRSGLAELSPVFAGSCSVGFILADSRPVIEAHDTAFDRFGRRRPTACSVCTQPLSLWAGKYPLAATILRQVPTAASDIICRTFRLSVERFSSPRFRFDSHRFKLSPHGAQCHVSQVIGFGSSPEPYAVVCILPLLL